MRRLAMGSLAVLLSCGLGAAGARREHGAGDAVSGPGERWVDASAPSDGDGSRERPWRSLADALEAGGGHTLRVATGLYKGPFKLPANARIVGAGEVVLHSDGPGPVVEAPGGAELRSIRIQGGGVGLTGGAAVRLDAVAFSGQRVGAVEQLDGALTATRLDVDGTVSGTNGVRVASGASAVLSESKFRGGLRVGIELEANAVARAASVGFEGVATAARSRGGTLHLVEASASGGRGPAFVCAGGEMSLRNARVVTHEYGVMASSGCALRVQGFTSIRAERAGISVAQGASAVLEDVTVLESGGFGGIQSVNGSVVLRRFWIARARSYGIQLTGGTAELRDGAVSGVTDPDGGAGDGLHARNARVKAASISIRDTAGPGVLAAQGARVALRDVQLEGNGWAGLLVETLARAEAASLVVRRSRGNAVAVPSRAVARVDLLVAEEIAEDALVADCAEGAVLQVSRARVGAATLAPSATSACVRPWVSPVLFDPFLDGD